ncbi:MAG TPA: hypothetical protein PK880_02440 [Candidatus Competibacter sp.]|nr:hypothetical protein [Candidatus Competibacter sp.]
MLLRPAWWTAQKTLPPKRGRDTKKYVNALAQQENDDATRKMKGSGKTELAELSEAQQESWHKAMLPVYKEMAGRIGQDLIEQIYNESAALGFK